MEVANARDVAMAPTQLNQGAGDYSEAGIRIVPVSWSS